MADQKDVHIRLKLDNSSAIANINNRGGIKSSPLNSLARRIWEWCMHHNIFISAQHVRGKSNFTADALSRETSTNLKWSLDTNVFERLLHLTMVPDIDLFALRPNSKGNNFVSWHPEPGATAVNAFSISWAHLRSYAFPPFSVLSQVLRKIRDNKAVVLLIAPVWTTQSWYPLLQLLIEEPILLPKKENLLVLPRSKALYPMRNSLVLAAWMLSGDPSEVEVFLMNQPASLPHLGPLGLIDNTIQPGKSGVAGVTKEKLIYSRRL